MKSNIKIIGGEARGRKIFSVGIKSVRPAMAIVRKSIFDTLSNEIIGKKVLDLFAGTGSVGFEALSRGAKFCAFVDIEKKCVEAIQQTAKSLNWEGRSAIFLADVFRCDRKLSALGLTFDFLFIDPPYDLFNSPAKVADLLFLFRKFEAFNLIFSNTKIIIEHRKNQIEKFFSDVIYGYKIYRQRRFGSTVLSFVSKSHLSKSNEKT